MCIYVRAKYHSHIEEQIYFVYSTTKEKGERPNIFFKSVGPRFWSSQRQERTDLSSTDAEICSTSNASKAIVNIHHYFKCLCLYSLLFMNDDPCSIQTSMTTRAKEMGTSHFIDICYRLMFRCPVAWVDWIALSFPYCIYVLCLMQTMRSVYFKSVHQLSIGELGKLSISDDSDSWI